MSKMNDVEGTGYFASENNCMFMLTSMLLNEQLSKSKDKPVNIYIESKHSTSLFVSFGIIGIKCKYYDQLLQCICKHFQSYNGVGASRKARNDESCETRITSPQR